MEAHSGHHWIRILFVSHNQIVETQQLNRKLEEEGSEVHESAKAKTPKGKNQLLPNLYEEVGLPSLIRGLKQ